MAGPRTRRGFATAHGRRGRRVPAWRLSALLSLPLLAAPIPDAALAQQPSDPVRSAAALQARGRPVDASRLLARAVAERRIDGPSALLALAESYAAWEAWPAVIRTLAEQPWLAEEADGRGLELIGFAQLAEGQPDRAVTALQRRITDVPAAPDPAVHVALGRARLAQNDPAAAATAFENAMWLEPELEDWIGLSALYAAAAAGDRTRATEFAVRAGRSGQVPGDSLRAPLIELAYAAGDADSARSMLSRAGERLRLRFAFRAAQHERSRGRPAEADALLLELLEEGRPPAEAGRLALERDRGWRTLRLVGEAEIRAGRRRHGIDLLREAREDAPAVERPGLDEAVARAHRAAGEHEAALEALNPWLSGQAALPPARQASLWYLASQTYRSLGRVTEADRALAAAAGGEGVTAALASYLIADAHHDAHRLADAHRTYAATFERFPSTPYGERSLERLAMLDFSAGRFRDARAGFEAYRNEYPRSDWARGAIYWTARALEAEGDSATARVMYRETIVSDPLDYYAMLAAERTGVSPFSFLRLADAPVARDPRPEHLQALARMNRLRELGWAERGRLEYARSVGEGARDPERLLGFAHALNRDGWTWEGVRLAFRVRAASGRWSRALLEGVYPLPYAEALLAAAGERGLEPAFVAGLARRESLWDARIISSANAVGLMQLLPRTAQDMARRAGVPEYQRPQLTVPQVNLLLGTRYLADLLDRFDGRRLAGLVGYNAGPHRWIRWRSFPESSDDQLFVERIPFRETREYARAVTELAEIYAYLYPELASRR